jgi:hypothetical protein
MNQRFLVKLAMVLCVTVAIAPAVAGAYTLEKVNFNWDDQYEGKAVYNGKTKKLPASNFSVSILDENDAFLLGEDGKPDWFTAFCLEPLQTAGKKNVDVDLVAPSTLQGGLESAWLVENADDYTEDEFKKYSMAALQFAIWEVMMDYDAGHLYDLRGGDFVYTKMPGETEYLAGLYLGALKDSFSSAGLDEMYSVSQTGKFQDFIINVPGTAPVPEPGTMVLLAFGLIGMAGFGRKFRRQN